MFTNISYHIFSVGCLMSLPIRDSEIVNSYYVKEKEDKIFSLEKTLRELELARKENARLHAETQKKLDDAILRLDISNQQLESATATTERIESKMQRLTLGVKNLPIISTLHSTVSLLSAEEFSHLLMLNSSDSRVVVISSPLRRYSFAGFGS